MEQLVRLLIYIHAFFGGLGLISGVFGLIVKKGSLLHKRSGKVFSYSMLTSSVISLLVSQMPKHQNVFLFLIGIFTIYLVLAGNRALTLKNKMKMRADWIDKTVSGSMMFTSILMLGVGIKASLQQSNSGILFFFFGGFGLFMTIKDFYTFKVFREKKNAWLISHIGRMVGAFIASITAFIVAGLHMETFLTWITPSIVGIIYIIYWNRKIKSYTAVVV